MEVLVAMLVLAIGLLGLASLQAQSLRFNHDSYVRSQATILAGEIADTMRADPDTDYADTAIAPVLPDDCDLNDDEDLILSVVPLVQKCFWLLDIQNRLPAGTATIVVNPIDNRMYDITILWSDRENNTAADCAAAAGGAATRTFNAIDQTCLVAQLWTVFP